MEVSGTVQIVFILSVVFGAGVLYRGHYVMWDEIKALRQSRHDHANTMQRTVTLLETIERRVTALEEERVRSSNRD